MMTFKLEVITVIMRQPQLNQLVGEDRGAGEVVVPEDREVHAPEENSCYCSTFYHFLNKICILLVGCFSLRTLRCVISVLKHQKIISIIEAKNKKQMQENSLVFCQLKHSG
jgi:hypothetical protein